MELSADVRVKIKSAIKARLKELGIAWDRELPDYVMVLIANKKTKEEMETDLKIFLGTHTAGFTSWLHNVMQKLEECGVTSRVASKKRTEEKRYKIKRRTSEENKQDVKKLKSDEMEVESDSDGYSSSTFMNQDTKTEDTVNRGESMERTSFTDDGEVWDRRHVSTDSYRETSTVVTGTSAGVSAGKSSIFVGKDVEKEEQKKPKERIHINWDQEGLHISKLEPDNENSSRDRRGRSRNRSVSRQRSKSRNRSRSASRGHEQKHISILRKHLKENNGQKDRGDERKESKNYFSRKKGSADEKNGNGSSNSRKKSERHRNGKEKKTRKHSRDSVAREEKLASLVKVTPRPIRPASMQPNPNLILKAVADAHKSIATSILPQPEKKLKNKEENTPLPHTPTAKINDNIYERENISVTLLNDRVFSNRIDDPELEQIPAQVNGKKSRPVGPEVERFTISILEDDNDSIVSDFDKNYSLENIQIVERNGKKSQHDGPAVKPLIVSLESDGSDSDIASHPDLDGTDDLVDVVEQVNPITVPDEEPMEIALSLGLSVEVSKEVNGHRFDRSRLGPRITPDPNTVLNCLALPGEILKTIVNENAMEGIETRTDENGKVIKCKFWPSCEAGDDCRFYHPKEYCRTLPNCKFGQKCLYYHPPCKFADKCLNVSCPYTHAASPTSTSTAKVKAWTKVPLGPSNGQICMYYPNCTKPFCPYQHGFSSVIKKLVNWKSPYLNGASHYRNMKRTIAHQPCKYGASCSKLGCDYDHSQSGKNPYKWVASNPE